MLYKPDWEETKERFIAWWAGEVLDRVAMSVTAPNGKSYRQVAQPGDPFRLHGDPEYLVEVCEATFSTTYYAAEAFPCRTLLIGYVFLDTPVTYAPNTIWSKPVIEDYGRDMPLFDTAAPGWQTIAGVVRTLAEAGRGKWMVEFPTIIDPTDMLSGLRGNQKLCTDMIDRPDDVHRALDYLTGTWMRAYAELGAMLRVDEVGSTGWLPLWSPGMSTTIYCDYSCLISNEMFVRFVVPDLQTRARWLHNCIYHLDGPDAIHHLDTLLQIPEIRGIQWVPGSGAPPCLEWLPLLRRIQDAGKLLHISIPAADVQRALTELKPEGLFLVTRCDSVAEADALVAMAERLTSSHH